MQIQCLPYLARIWCAYCGFFLSILPNEELVIALRKQAQNTLISLCCSHIGKGIYLLLEAAISLYIIHE